MILLSCSHCTTFVLAGKIAMSSGFLLHLSYVQRVACLSASNFIIAARYRFSTSRANESFPQ
jgi:hypothetical protein